MTEFEMLLRHAGHNIVCITYRHSRDPNAEAVEASIECEDCQEVLYSAGKYEEEEEANEVFDWQ